MWNKINVCIEIAFNIVRLVVLVIRLFKYWDFDTEKYFDIFLTFYKRKTSQPLIYQGLGGFVIMS